MPDRRVGTAEVQRLPIFIGTSYELSEGSVDMTQKFRAG